MEAMLNMRFTSEDYNSFNYTSMEYSIREHCYTNSKPTLNVTTADGNGETWQIKFLWVPGSNTAPLQQQFASSLIYTHVLHQEHITMLRSLRQMDKSMDFTDLVYKDCNAIAY